MEIILKTDVENLGLEFDTVNVKPGYARNFLLPKGLGLLATPKNKAALAETLESRKEEEARIYKCPTCQFLDLHVTSLGTIARCTGNTPKTRAEKFEREFLHGRNYDTLDEYKKDCIYYKKKEA